MILEIYRPPNNIDDLKSVARARLPAVVRQAPKLLQHKVSIIAPLCRPWGLRVSHDKEQYVHVGRLMERLTFGADLPSTIDEVSCEHNIERCNTE
jgi:hypothetical protein